VIASNPIRTLNTLFSYPRSVGAAISNLFGRNVVRHARSAGHDVTGTYNTTDAPEADVHLDKTGRTATRDLVVECEPDAIVDTAAFPDGDARETERGRAYEVNAIGTRHVAEAAEAVGAHLVYLSTDYVFRGDPTEAPYDERAPVAPPNYYARTKYAGEVAAATASTHTTLRSSVVYGQASDNFVTWALAELEAGEELGIVDDQTSSPTYAPDLAQAVLETVTEGIAGTYHAAGPVDLTRYEFTVVLAEEFGHDAGAVTPITMAELGQAAPRPSDSSLDSARLSERPGLRFRTPSEAFAAMSE
jgi:dTDP-4-dehydrorhamnose reductase